MTTSTPAAVHPLHGHRPDLGRWARRWPAAVGVGASLAGLAAVAPFSQPVRIGVSAWSVLLAAVVYLAWGTARGDLARRRLLLGQTAAVLAFGALAVTAVAVAPDVSRYILAGGWLAHATWDVIHHRAGCVVPRWYAELCLATDLVIAGALLTTNLV